MPRAYYNEFDKNAAAWLRKLIAAGLIAPGDVDDRSIRDVKPDDLNGYTQVHLFAGIGIWSYAMRAAGWPDERRVWTASCPCQPFSAAGRGLGVDDERHLWPEVYRLFCLHLPDELFIEQVSSKDGLAWRDLVQADVEDAGYSLGGFDTCAAGVGAPHIRQRQYGVIKRVHDPAGPRFFAARQRPEREARDEARLRGFERGRRDDELEYAARDGRLERRAEPSGRSAAGGCSLVGLGDDDGGERFQTRELEAILGTRRTHEGRAASEPSEALGGVADFDGGESGVRPRETGHATRGSERAIRRQDGQRVRPESERGGEACGLADGDDAERRTDDSRRHHSDGQDAGRTESTSHAEGCGVAGRMEYADGGDTGAERQQRSGQHGQQPQDRGFGDGPEWASPTNGFWATADWLFCRDERWRPVESGTFPLVDGDSGRVGALRAYGNALCAPQAIAFIETFLECEAEGFPDPRARCVEDVIG